jgi:hypothetical protein
MRKSTHTGTCQVCGSQQALPAGRLSLHGYTVEHGFFNGTCPGANHLPLEQDRDLADAVAASLTRQADELRAKAAKIEAGTVRPVYAAADFYWTCKDRTGRSQDVQVLFADAKPCHQQAAVDSLLYATQRHAEHAQRIADDITKRANSTHGKPLTPRAAEEPRKIIAVGTQIKLYGKVVTVTGIADRVARGVGPFLNGQCIQHFSFTGSNGQTYWSPTRFVRQAAIL